MESKLQLIEEYASLYLTVDEIALLIDIDLDQFKREIRMKAGDMGKAYLKGKLQTTLEMRRQTKTFATKGSPQAENLMREYSIQQKRSEQ